MTKAEEILIADRTPRERRDWAEFIGECEHSHGVETSTFADGSVLMWTTDEDLLPLEMIAL